MEKRSGRELTNLILMFIEDYGLITVNQAAKIFYKDNTYGELQASQKLSKMYKNKVLKRECVFGSKKYIYYTDKHPKYHQILLLDVYAEFVYSGAEIINFKAPITYHIPKRIQPDGLIIYKYNGEKFAAFIECDYTHEPSNERYERLYKSGKVQKELKGFPNVLRINEKNREDIYGNNYDIIYLHHDLKNFKEKVLL